MIGFLDFPIQAFAGPYCSKVCSPLGILQWGVLGDLVGVRPPLRARARTWLLRLGGRRVKRKVSDGIGNIDNIQTSIRILLIMLSCSRANDALNIIMHFHSFNDTQDTSLPRIFALRHSGRMYFPGYKVKVCKNKILTLSKSICRRVISATRQASSLTNQILPPGTKTLRSSLRFTLRINDPPRRCF